MLKKIAVVGGIVAVTGLGVGGAASAWSGAGQAQAVATPSVAVSTLSTAATPSPSTGSATAPGSSKTAGHVRQGDKSKKRERLVERLAKVSHAQWVSKDGKTGTFVTHDAVQGDVAAVGTGSITIKATDGTTETFVVTGSTKVRVHGTHAPAALSQVKVGDRAAVFGTGSGTMTATHVVDRGVPGAAHKAGHPKKSGTAKSGSAGSSTTTTVPPTS